MHASVLFRWSRLLTPLFSALVLAGCGQGDGPDSIQNQPATPLPPIAPGFCDPINFEILCPAVDIINFNGGATTVVDNPVPSTASVGNGGVAKASGDASNKTVNGGDAQEPVTVGNTSESVAQMQKFPDEPFGGTRLDIPAPLDFTNGESFTVKVWSQREVPVLFKLEQLNVERIVSHSGSSAWEELCFDFSGATSGPANDGLTFIFDNGVLGQADSDPDNWTFYYDDITQVESCGGSTLPDTFSAITFDDAELTYTLTGFGGAEDSTIVNDPAGGTNQVAQVNRSDGAETFAGTTVSLGPNESVPDIPLDSASPQMTVRVWSPAAGIPVRLKVENAGDSAVSVETEALTTVADAWETLTFDFTMPATDTPAFDAAATYNKIIIFFNFGADGASAGAQTFYFDDMDVASGGGGTPTPFSAVTFDDMAVTYTLRGFGGAEDSTVVADPDDAANNAVQVNRSAAAETFAGTVPSTLANESVGVIPLDASNTQMTLRVRGPAAGVPVRMKIENSGDPAITVETEATTTAVDTWETLSFDFANPASGTAAFDPAAIYDKVVIFYNFGTDGATAGAQTFYFDDIDVAGGSGGGGGGGAATPVGFEGGSASFANFEGGVATVIANPDQSGINTSNFVGQMQKFAGQSFGGSTLDLGGAVALADGDSYTMKVRAQRSVVVTFKLEPQGDERTATYSGSGTWEELCFDFTGVSGDVTGITLIFDNGTVGDADNDPDNWTFQFDDIEQTSAACPDPAPAFTTVTFDDSALTYSLRDFGGAASTLTNDPAGGSNTVVQVVRSAVAETFAGSVFWTMANESVGVIPLEASSSEMTIRVYSPATGIPVRLKIENSGDPAVSVETEATTTVMNDWETLTFDFANEVSGTAAFNPAAIYDKMVIFFNFGTDGATAGEQTFYFDDVAVGTGSGGGSSSFDAVDFDDTALTYTLRGFGGAEDSTVVADPDDASNNAVQVNRSAAAETFAGTVVSTGANESIPVIPLDASNTQMTLRVRGPAAGVPVRMKIENSGDPAVSVETEATTTVVDTWETLTFDFANEVSGTAAFNPAATYDKVVIFYNFGTDGATAGAQTFYFDDIDVASSGGGSGGNPGGGSAVITFDDMMLTYTLRGFGGAEDSTVVTDPTGGPNMVAQVNRSAAAETFAGTVVSTGANESVPVLALDAANTQMTVRVYAPASGIPVRLKVEDASDPTVSVETEATTTTANAWETLTFDFANEAMGTAAFNPAATYNKIAIFFNFGTDGATAGAQTYFFDDIDVGGP